MGAPSQPQTVLAANFNFLLRNPRHEQGQNQSVRVEVTRRNHPQAPPLPAKLVDVSRQGVGFEVGVKIERGEVVTVSVADEGFQVSWEVTIRWVKGASATGCTAGGEFGQELPWETLGELFLRGVLAT